MATTAATVPDARLMAAAVFTRPGEVSFVERPYPTLASPADVLLGVEACGICGTDLHVTEDPPGHPGTPGVVLGHEMVGRVLDRGPDVVDLEVGDRVVVSPNIRCNACDNCKRGMFSACEHFSTIGIFQDGGLAQAVSVPGRACYGISPDIPAKIAALTEPLSCVMNGVEQARPLPGEVAVVYGAGAIGLLFLAVLRAGGVRCLVVEPSPTRRATAEAMGATWTLNPADGDVRSTLGAAAPDGPDIAVDAAGTLLTAAIADVRPGGRILLFGFDTRARPAVPQSEITRKELTVHGTWVGDFTFPAAIRLQESGLLDLEPIVSHWLPLSRVGEAFDALRAGTAVKAVLEIPA